MQLNVLRCRASQLRTRRQPTTPTVRLAVPAMPGRPRAETSLADDRGGGSLLTPQKMNDCGDLVQVVHPRLGLADADRERQRGLTPHKVVRDLDRRAIPNEAKVVAVDVRFERARCGRSAC